MRVELRKMADTRAGFWLLLSIGLITAAILVIFLLVAPDDQKTFLNFMGATATPQGFLLPVLGILLVTSEWGQRTALTTFALEPSRPRVIGAKFVAALLIGLAAIVVAVALAAPGHASSAARTTPGRTSASTTSPSSGCSRSAASCRAWPSACCCSTRPPRSSSTSCCRSRSTSS